MKKQSFEELLPSLVKDYENIQKLPFKAKISEIDKIPNHDGVGVYSIVLFTMENEDTFLLTCETDFMSGDLNLSKCVYPISSEDFESLDKNNYKDFISELELVSDNQKGSEILNYIHKEISKLPSLDIVPKNNPNTIEDFVGTIDFIYSPDVLKCILNLKK